MTLKKPVISEAFQKFKGKFKGGKPAIGVLESQKFKYNAKEKAIVASSSNLKTVGKQLDEKLDELKIDYDMSEAETDSIVAQRVAARMEQEAIVAAQEAAAAEAERKRLKANLLTEEQIKSGKIRRRWRKKRGKRRGYYFLTVGGIDLSPIERYRRKKDIPTRKYRDEVEESVNIYNEAVKQGIAELEGKGNKRKIKILDKDKFQQLIKDRNKKDPPKTKKQSKASAEATENKIKK